MMFAAKWREILEANLNIDFWQEMVTGILVKDGRCAGVKTGIGLEIESKTVVLTNGTFLNGLIHIGEKQFGGGRAGERASTGITEQLKELGFESGRMKTGTPPRIDGRSLKWEDMELQEGDAEPCRFSFTDTPNLKKQLPCHVAYTNKDVHETLKEGFDRSPMFNGRIRGLGPRYCPSIEDKIDRFADRDRHQLFVEPEGWNTCEIYVNGFSSSLPEEVQYKSLKKVPGFQDMKMFRPGYAIEYDYFPPTQLDISLQTRQVPNLFFAGQINGTTGYEEAASQGMIAGINANLCHQEKDPFVLLRSEAYIGVLIDDLVNKGTDEPYRMFTSRAEFRILLRQDNADLRLTPRAQALGMSDMDARMERVSYKLEAEKNLTKYIANTSVHPDDVNAYLASKGSAPLSQKVKMHSLIMRPNVSVQDIAALNPDTKQVLSTYDDEVVNLTEISLKYSGYIEKEREMADKMGRLEDVHLHSDFDYKSLESLSAEAREKLSVMKPRTIGQASRISGVSPSDISVLLVHVGR
jgi:tRNA uridine 5-carboxymethylaminomethyl modification enzyme